MDIADEELLKLINEYKIYGDEELTVLVEEWVNDPALKQVRFPLDIGLMRKQCCYKVN